MQQEQYLKPKQVANMIGMSVSSVYRLRGKDGFPVPVRLSEARVAFKSSEVDYWLSTRTSAGARP